MNKKFDIKEVKNWLKSHVADFIVAPGRGQIEIDFSHMFQHLDDGFRKEDQEEDLNEQKAKAWDNLYEKITGRDLVHLQVDLADIEEQMDKLLAQEKK